MLPEGRQTRQFEYGNCSGRTRPRSARTASGSDPRQSAPHSVKMCQFNGATAGLMLRRVKNSSSGAPRPRSTISEPRIPEPRHSIPPRRSLRPLLRAASAEYTPHNRRNPSTPERTTSTVGFGHTPARPSHGARSNAATTRDRRWEIPDAVRRRNRSARDERLRLSSGAAGSFVRYACSRVF